MLKPVTTVKRSPKELTVLLRVNPSSAFFGNAYHSALLRCSPVTEYPSLWISFRSLRPAQGLSRSVGSDVLDKARLRGND